MKYNAPYGSTDPNAPYKDRSTPDAVQGSKVPAKAVEHPQREIVAVIAAAGLTPGDDTTQLLQALRFFFAQFPIYPECLNSNGTFDVVTPSTGIVRIPAGISWVIRGATRWATADVINLNTISSKTYHLRWDAAHGFRLRDLADVAYNPTAAAENNIGFDSTFDDMLVARVTTNGGNAVTITNLINKAKLSRKNVFRDVVSSAYSWTTWAGTAVALNWARTPDISFTALKGFRSHNHDADGSETLPGEGKVRAIEVRIPNDGSDRYGIAALEYYYDDDTETNGWMSAIVINQAA